MKGLLLIASCLFFLAGCLASSGGSDDADLDVPSTSAGKAHWDEKNWDEMQWD